MTEPETSLTERVLTGFLDRGIEPQELNKLQSHAAVEQARSEIRYGYLRSGAELLEEVVRQVRGSSDKDSRSLFAVAHSVWGQGLETWGDAASATRYFRIAVDAFDEVGGTETNEQLLRQAIGPRAISDLGMALDGIGEGERARRVLEISRRFAQSTPEALRRLASYAADDGDLAGAQELLNEALPILPTDAESWYTTALVREKIGADGVVIACRQAAALWLRRGAFDQALPAIRRLLELQPDDPTVLIALAEALRNTGQLSEALQVANQAVATAPNEPEASLVRALVRRQLADHDKALEDVEHILQITDAGDPGALLVRAYVHADRGEFDRSLQDVEAALTADPQFSLALAHKGLLLMAAARYDQARDPLLSAHLALRHDLQLTRRYAEVAWHLSDFAVVIETLGPIWRDQALDDSDISRLVDALFQEGQPDDALHVARAKYDESRDSLVRRQLVASVIARRTFDYEYERDDLIAMADEATALAPDEPDVQVLRGMCRRAQEDDETAEDLFLLALRSNPHHLKAIEQLTDLLLDHDRPAEAERWCRIALAISEDPAFRLRTAISLRMQQRHREVVPLLADIPPDVGRYHTVWLQLRADAQAALSRWGAAQKDRAELVELNPENPESWLALAEAAWAAGDWETAVQASTKTLDIQPDSIAARGILGAALALGGQLDKARAELDKALNADPTYEFGLMRRAAIASTVEEGLDCLVRLAEINPEAARLQRAWLLLQHGRPGDALAEFMPILDTEPDNVEVLVGAAACNRALGNLNVASALAQRAVELEPDNISGLRELAGVKIESGFPSDALIHLQHALEIVPSDVELSLWLVETLRTLDRVQESFEAVDRIVERRQRDPMAWSGLGDHLIALGYFDEAVDPLRRSLELNPAASWAHHSLAWALEHKNDPDLVAALEEYEEANRLTTDNFEIMRNLADAKHQLRIPGAEQLYKELIERAMKEPGRALEAEWQIGWCLFRMGDLPRAGRHLFAATAMPPRADEIRLDLGLVSLCRGREEDALKHYEAAVARIHEREAHRWRSPVRVAQLDLQVACRDWPGLADRPATTKIREMLTVTLAAVPPLPRLQSLRDAENSEHEIHADQ